MRTLDKIKQPLAIKPRKITPATPCAVEITTLFNCWRSIAVDAPACAESGKALIKCMQTKVRGD